MRTALRIAELNWSINALWGDGWGRGRSAGSPRGVPRLMLASLVLGELPIRDAMVGVAVLD